MHPATQISEHVRFFPDARVFRHGDNNSDVETPHWRVFDQTLRIARSIIDTEMRSIIV